MINKKNEEKFSYLFHKFVPMTIKIDDQEKKKLNEHVSRHNYQISFIENLNNISEDLVKEEEEENNDFDQVRRNNLFLFFLQIKKKECDIKKA